ncbi:MAG: hypothetical protein V2A78_11245 [bacterium]
MNESVATKLLKDIEFLIDAHDRLMTAKRRIRELDPGAHEQISHSPSLAAWLHLKGYVTDDQVFDFIKKAWDEYEGDKSQFWVWHGPDHDDPAAEVDRLLDRIDMSMGLIAQNTQTQKPIDSVRDYGWHPEPHLRRILAFAQAASDLG